MAIFIITICVAYAYLLLIVLSVIGWNKRTQAQSSEHSFPFCSVIVAARNEESHISTLCKQLLTQNYPLDSFEIIVINDHSTDNTLSVLNQIARTATNLIIINAPEDCNGKKQALQLALSQSHGSLLLFTDADCEIGPKWIETYVTFDAQNHGSFYFGSVIPQRLSNNLAEQFATLDFVGIASVQSGLAKRERAFSCNGANMCISREFYQKSYNTNSHYDSGDDVFLLHKAKQQDNKSVHFIQSSKASVQTTMPQSFTQFFNQRIRWASKAGGYKDFDSILVSLIVYVTSFLLLILGIISLTNNTLAIVCFCILFVTKTIADCIIFVSTAKYFRTKRLLWLVLPFQCVYFIYISIIPIFAMFFSSQWKKRPLKK